LQNRHFEIIIADFNDRLIHNIRPKHSTAKYREFAKSFL
jgi:hypothetical protein